MKSAYARRRNIENTYLVRERERKRLRELGLLLLIVAPVVVGVLGNVWIQVEVLAAGYRILELDQKVHELDQEELRLRLEAAYLASPERIETKALNDLGMEPVAVGQAVRPGQRSGDWNRASGSVGEGSQ